MLSKNKIIKLGEKMNFKKYTMIGILLILWGCSDKIIKEPTYEKDNMTYTVADNKPVNGIVEIERNSSKEYSSYEKGRLINLKKVDSKGRLIEEINYDSMKLFHGEILQGKSISKYNHGVLVEEAQDGEIIKYYDGTVDGEIKKRGIIKFYDKGIEVEEAPEKKKILKSKIAWGETPEKNYTGELYFTPISLKRYYWDSDKLEIRGYDNGELKYVKLYNKDGKKMREYYVKNGDIKSISSYSRYEDGVVQDKSSFDENGNRNGVRVNLTYDSMKTEKYKNGILHGEAKSVSLHNKKEILVGTYRLGIFTGVRGDINYIDGFESKKEPIAPSLSLNLKEKVEGENFTGFVKRKNKNKNIIIDEYNNGGIIKSYNYNEEKLEVITFLDKTLSEPSLDTDVKYPKGSYMEEIYCNGFLLNRSYYDSNGIKNGEFLSVPHRGSVSKGRVLNGLTDGILTHYHGDEIINIDKYRKGETYTRTAYHDYSKGIISEKSKGAYDKKNNMWISVGTKYQYSEDGKLKTKIEYGNEVSFEKKAYYTDYYDGKKIKAKYTKDYRGYRLIGEKKEYDKKGRRVKTSEINFL